VRESAEDRLVIRVGTLICALATNQSIHQSKNLKQAYARAGACVDEHTLDQLVIYMALARKGRSVVKGPPRRMISSLHVETAVHMGTWWFAVGWRLEPGRLAYAQLTHNFNTSAETITGVLFTQLDERAEDGGALVLEVAEGMGFTYTAPS
jgi:hypothetical protein